MSRIGPIPVGGGLELAAGLLSVRAYIELPVGLQLVSALRWRRSGAEVMAICRIEQGETQLDFLLAVYSPRGSQIWMIR